MLHVSIRSLKLLLPLFLVLVMGTTASAESWKLDPLHSTAHFSIRHMMIAQVRGMFPQVNGTITLDNGKPTAFDVTIDVRGINTGIAKRDEHLKSADFFDAAHYPTMTFKSSEVIPSGDGYQVTGIMTIKDVSRPMALLFTGLGQSHVDPWGNTRRGGKGQLVLDRRDFNIDWNAPLDGGGFMVGNMVNIVVDVEVLRP